MSSAASNAGRAAVSAGHAALLALALKILVALAPVLTVLLVIAAIFGPPPNDAPTTQLRYGASAFALRDIPARYLELYQAAEADYGIDWAILAGIGKVETDHGRLKAPGVTSGQNAHGCCAGPMQFHNDYGRGGGTWGAYGVDGDDDGRKDIYDPADAIASAGNYLRALGGAEDIRKALFGYNHAWWYVDKVERWADRYRGNLKTAGLDAPPDTGRLAWPVDGELVSPFGPRWGGMHEGIDIAVSAGTPVHAPADGTVTYAGWMTGYGNFVCLRHTARLTTCSAHLSRYRVKVGDRVARRDVIAASGCTGRCFGDHLHFEVHMAASWSKTSATNPLPYLAEVASGAKLQRGRHALHGFRNMV
ncbi:MAG TPA: peptidoglycan DD-metalloendopeptidase family protein [Solirubrobacteraceae bacterium]|nr:peptidoglycan DD-metalloendopeptidase family protein [Solirubrobacteraceae bacterium]